MIRKSGNRFSDRSCSNNNLERVAQHALVAAGAGAKNTIAGVNKL
jgi:hypothetical protein